MTDMAQADSTLRRRSSDLPINPVTWPHALRMAAKEMGHKHYLDIPVNSDENDTLITKAHAIRAAAAKEAAK